MSRWSPFSVTRFELLNSPPIWVPPWLDQLESDRHVYLPGSRGTGKTTLLQALNASSRLKNHHLRMQLSSDPFAKRYIGVYLRLPDYVNSDVWMARELEEYDDVSKAQRADFSRTLECQILQLLADRVADLRDAGLVALNDDAETQLVRECVAIGEDLLPLTRTAFPIRTLRELGTFYRRVHKTLQGLQRERGIGSERTPSALFPQVGSLLDSTATAVFHALNEGVSGYQWRLKVLVDDAEAMLHWQQIVLNTIVRLARNPVSFTIAYITNELDTETTLIENCLLTNADREVREPLERSGGKDFQLLAEAVATVFLQRSCPALKEWRFRALDLLGPTDVNELLWRKARLSESPEAERMLATADGFRNHPLVVSANAEEDQTLEDYDLPAATTGASDERQAEPPPIYQTFIIEAERLQERKSEWSTKARRRQQSAEIRKRMVAALVALCHKSRWSVPYAGAHAALHLADKCIRDWLDILHHLFVECDVDHDVLAFVRRSRLPYDLQSKAALRASEQKLRGIEVLVPFYPTDVANLVAALGLCEAELQTDANALRSPERGRFQMIDDPRTGDGRRAMALLKRGIDGGVLKFHKSSDSHKVVVSLHRLCAPVYGVSYRGPYYEVPVSASGLLRVAKAPVSRSGTPDARRVLRDLLARDESGAQQQALFNT